MSSQPFFALLLMYLKFIAVPGMKKISTNGTAVYFSPDYLEKLYESELDLILCHQLMHILKGHIRRPADMYGDDYHYACDVSVNCTLINFGFEEKNFPHLGKTSNPFQDEGGDLSEASPEEILSFFPFSLYLLDERSRSRFLPDSDEYWGQSGRFIDGILILDVPDSEDCLREQAQEDETFSGGSGGTEETDASQQDEWVIRVACAAKACRDNDPTCFGSLPENITRLINKLKPSGLDWRKILDEFIQERVSDYSFSPPDRRFADTGFFLPDFNEKEFVSQEILFMVDTSGSVDDDRLAVAYSEIKGAIEQFGNKLNGRLGFFDAAVTKPVPFENVDDLMSIIPFGGGGTDFRAIFHYLRNNCMDELPASIVIFTDGYGSYPSESETLAIPVLWLITDPAVVPPFGKTAYIPIFGE